MECLAINRTESTEQQAIQYSVSDGIAIVAMNRPEKLNALTDDMMDELLPAALRQADQDPDVRVVVVTGRGGNFCSGGDVAQRITGVRQRLRQTSTERQRDLGQFVVPIVDTEKPTIAAVDGVAAGGGLALAMACDLRTATEQARLCAPFISRGLVPDGGLTETLTDAVGYASAIDMCLTGRVVPAPEALTLRLVQRVWPAQTWWDQTLELAQRIATAPRQAALLTKRALSHGRNTGLRDALINESWFQSICMRDPDFDEGVASFLEKRAPQFRS